MMQGLRSTRILAHRAMWSETVGGGQTEDVECKKRVIITDETLSLEAQNLVRDKADGCFVSAYHNDALRFVISPPGGPIPHTRGQVSEAAVRELTVHGIAMVIISG